MDAIDVVIRIHDPVRLNELGRAVFSAALQEHRPASLLVVCQRFGATGLAAVRTALAPIMALVPDVALHVLDHTAPEPLDARAALLNQGIRAAQGRYLAFLDYDDVIYPEAYRMLIAELRESGAAIAFGGILNAYVERDGVVPFTRTKRRVFQGSGLDQLLHNNFCPLHSFVLDRARIAADELVIDEAMPALEDYELLLRLCARHRSSFRLKDKLVGEYLLKDDGSNLNPLVNPAGRAAWDAAWLRITALKAALVLSPEVQATLPEPGLTVAAFVARRSGIG